MLKGAGWLLCPCRPAHTSTNIYCARGSFVYSQKKKKQTNTKKSPAAKGKREKTQTGADGVDMYIGEEGRDCFPPLDALMAKFWWAAYVYVCL